METTVSVFPATVSQAASLSGLKPNEMALVTEAAFKGAESEGRSVTETDFRKAVEKVKPPKNKGKKKPSTKPKATPQPKADEVAVEVQPNDVPTGSVSVHVNTVSLVRPVRRIFELFGLKPRDSQNLNGTVFTFDGTAIDEKNLFENLADLAVSEGPLDLRITLE